MPLSSTVGNLAIKAITKLIGQQAMLVALKPEGAEAIQLQYNPSEFKITEKSNYAEQERNRRDDPVVSFTGKPMSTLNMRLYFNADEPMSVISALGALAGAVAALAGADGLLQKKESIEKVISKISALTMIEGDVHSPPNAMFFWGSIMFTGYIQSVATSYTMFDKSGKVLRATVDLTMIGYNNIKEERSSPLQSPDRTKAKVLTEDSSIFSIAQAEYGDARDWRRIADANGIMNPLDIKVGRTLKVPSIND